MSKTNLHLVQDKRHEVCSLHIISIANKANIQK